jgi:tetratricopeptide (TPR) repeat protein
VIPRGCDPARVAHRLLKGTGVDTASVLRAAIELYQARHYSSVIAALADAIEEDPANLHLKLLRAKAWLALRCDLEAQQDLSDVIRTDPRCSTAYRLLGELAVRKDEIASARIFLREALRLDPGDVEAKDWLALTEQRVRPSAAAEKLPAAAAADGHFDQPVDRSPRAAPSRARSDVSATRAEKRARIATVGDVPTSLSELPAAGGFGRYLVECGLLTPLQLRAALAYQRSTGIKLGAAAAALGFVSQLKIEWASLAYHGQFRRGSNAQGLIELSDTDIEVIDDTAAH